MVPSKPERKSWADVASDDEVQLGTGWTLVEFRPATCMAPLSTDLGRT